MEKWSKEIYTAELKSEVVKLVLDQGQGVIAVSQRMGISKVTPSTWVNKARSILFASPQGIKVTSLDLEAENKRLKQALARAEMECDILKKATVSSTGQRNTRIKFIGRGAKVQGFPWALI